MKFIGKPGEWYQDDSIGGYFDENGIFIMCEDYGNSQQLGAHDEDVMNGLGYYDYEGCFHWFLPED